VTSPGHRLGQMIGEFFEDLFADDLTALATRLGFYCDKRGPRPARGTSKRIVWRDNQGNDHALDYVIEKDGSPTRLGQPVAFVELAWRRYPKHSRNKSGEIANALVPLRETYSSCRFTGTVLAGEYTAGGKNQLTSQGIQVLHIPFAVLAASFRVKRIDLEYAEAAPNDEMQRVIDAWEALTEDDIKEIRHHLRQAIREEYSAFTKQLEAALSQTVETIRILPLYGSELVVTNAADAINALKGYVERGSPELQFAKYEIQVRFTNGDKVDGTFGSKEQAMAFLATFA
jgi:hypothetical protein